jgi:hypothetical protein
MMPSYQEKKIICSGKQQLYQLQKNPGQMKLFQKRTKQSKEIKIAIQRIDGLKSIR